MADDNQLPEGTDKVIAGASATNLSNAAGTGGTSGTGLGGTGTAGADGDVLVATESAAATVVPGDRRAVGGAGSGTIDRLRSGGNKLTGQAADKARSFVGQGIERSAEALANVSRLVGDTATGLDERLGEDYGNYARRAAEAIENAANSIASKDADELIDDTRNFVRKSPAVALAGAAVAGFVIARLVKTGLAAASDGDDDRDDSSGKGSKGSSRA